MFIFFTRFAIYGVGSGNAPALHILGVGHLTMAFYFILNQNVTLSKTGYNRARCLRRI